MRKLLLLLFLAVALSAFAQSQPNVVDEIVWVVGDDPIYLSDVEDVIVGARMNNETLENPYCTVPEQIAVKKLFLHQADLDSVDIGEADVIEAVNGRINDYLQFFGSRENVEAWAHRSMAQIRDGMKRSQRDELRIEQVQRSLTANIKLTPAEVREYFRHVPTDSLPVIPTQVEVQILTSQPQPSREEVERVEDRLREIARKVNAGETEFATQARFYSEDEVSARNGGELDYMGRNQMVQEFSNVAFSLNDPKRVSKIVKTEFGYHIIQLIDKRGEKVKVRHILMRPVVQDSAYNRRIATLDSVASDIREGKSSFEEAVRYLSDDKNTYRNNGLLFYQASPRVLPTSRIEMKDLNQDIAKVVDTLRVGQVSDAFIMTNDKGQKVCAIVKLKNRIESHPASMTEDFQRLHDVVFERRCEERLEEWVRKKVKATYVRIKPEWRSCQFKYDGWLK
ncbi:MAG: peptidylprolyl isomerase [Alloprevotella sp.]|nr:peptidylprolyl isomerase [Alloprevotella sp.]